MANEPTHSITILFHESHHFELPPRERQQAFKAAVEVCARQLVADGSITSVEVEYVFPDHDDRVLSSMLVARVQGLAEKAVNHFQKIPGVQHAYIAPRREQ